MQNKNRAGRPSVINQVALDRLISAFKIGATDTEACDYAEVSESSLYRYEKLHPEFRERKQGYKREPVLKSKMTIVKAISYDVKVAMWYLERKARDEFGTKIAPEETRVPIGAPQNEREAELLATILKSHFDYVQKKTQAEAGRQQ